MRDALKTYLTLAAGLAEVPRRRAMAAAKALVSSGEATAEQVSALAEDLIEQTKQNREAVVALVGSEVDRALGRIGLANADDVTSLRERVRVLEAEARQASPAARAPVTKAPVTKAPVAKAPVTKAPAKKAPAGRGSTTSAADAKKAPAKKAAVKKAAAQKQAHQSDAAKALHAEAEAERRTPAGASSDHAADAPVTGTPASPA